MLGRARSFLSSVACAIVILSGVGVTPAKVALADDALPAGPSGTPGVAWAWPDAGSANAAALAAPIAQDPVNASYSHTPAVSSQPDLPAGSGNIMVSQTIYLDFWLPAGQHFESTSAGDTNFENLQARWVTDVGGTAYHKLVTQYNGKNGTIGQTVTLGGTVVRTGAYPHAGSKSDPLTQGDVTAEVAAAVAAQGWAESASSIVLVFTAANIQQCNNFSATDGCTFVDGVKHLKGYCAFHDHFSDGGTDAIYGYLSLDNGDHGPGVTCNAGDTGTDTDPNRFTYPNSDKTADVEVNTMSHEVIEAATDPHPNDTWTASDGEIGDKCNYNFTPRNSVGADVYLQNGHGYILQQEFSNAVHTCAIDLCGSSVCPPTPTFTKTVDVTAPEIGHSIHYTVTLNNTDDSGAATNLVFTDTTPAGYSVTSFSAPNSTSSSQASNTVTVNYDTLPVHQVQTITITATVPVQAGVTATNCGSLTLQNLLGTALAPLTTSPCASTTPVKVPTTLTYTGDTSADFNNPATLSATLTDDMGNGIPTEPVTLSLNGTETCNLTTDGGGNVSCSVTPSEAAGSYLVIGTFSGDAKYQASSSSTPFVVNHEESALTSSAALQLFLQGGTATLSSVLTDPVGGGPIASKMVTMTLGSGAGSQSCTGTTDGTGTATCSISPVTVANGPQPITDSFAGDAFYVPASHSQNALLFAFPTGGTFVIGDQSATGSVTFWGAQWATDNSLSGGSAPSSFKGFESGNTLPVCGAGWTARPGNSGHPPDTIPSFMGVIVASHAQKKGSIISGDVASIVIVQTDPGYAGNPGSPGTGTVVATFC